MNSPDFVYHKNEFHFFCTWRQGYLNQKQLRRRHNISRDRAERLEHGRTKIKQKSRFGLHVLHVWCLTCKWISDAFLRKLSSITICLTVVKLLHLLCVQSYHLYMYMYKFGICVHILNTLLMIDFCNSMYDIFRS